MTLTAGTKLGRYEIRSVIGVGGMGEVYRASDPKLGRDVAIKVLPADFSADKERGARFEQEAQAAGALNHPSIIADYDVDTQDDVLYVVSELLEGEELRQRLDEGSIPLRKATDYAQQIVSGLSAAHEKGIVHRDLKPENLFITKDDRVKILDIGLTKRGKWQVSTGGGGQPHWRRDGKELYYIAPDRKLMAVSVKLGETIENGAATPLFQTQVSSFINSNRYDVAADGQRFLVNSPVESGKEAPFNVILNCPSTLKK